MAKASPTGKSNTLPGGRVQGAHIALPLDVTDSLAYQSLSGPAIKLLIEFARAFVLTKGQQNGQLRCTYKHLKTRGWKSNDTFIKAKKELLDAGFIHEIVKGHRPNKASEFALTWYDLCKPLPRADIGTTESFFKGAYRKNEPLRPNGGKWKSGQDRLSA